VASATARYLFATPTFTKGGSYEKDLLPPADETLTLKGVATPTSVTLLGDGIPLKYTYSDQTVTIQLPASRRTKLVDVVRVDL
jgi:alpha-L-fucosidase